MRKYDVYDADNKMINAISFLTKKEAQEFIYRLKNDKWMRSPFKPPLRIKEREDFPGSWLGPVKYSVRRKEGQWSNYP